MAINPVEVITAARKRIARASAIDAAVYFVAPAATAMVLAAFLPSIGAMTWEGMGYFLAPRMLDAARIALIGAAAIAIVVGVYRGWSAYAADDDFLGAAARIDERVHANEQVVTLATLADPEIAEATRSQRSPLFPVLWRNVTTSVSSFDPDREFRVEVGEPIKRSSLPSAAIAIALGIAMLALVRPPTPLETTAIQLRHLADKIEASATSPEDKKIAQQIRETAKELQNPTLPPEQKQKKLEEAMREVEKHEQQPGDKMKDVTGGSGSGKGSASANAAGGTEGKGEGGQSKGGQAKGGKGTGTGSGQGGNKKGDKNGSTDTIELKNELAKAEAQVQTEDKTAPQTPSQPSNDQKTAEAPRPGSDPNKQGGSDKNENQKGSAPMPVPQQDANGTDTKPAGQGKKPNQGGSGGDTHLGEHPKAANYERFLKPGEKGMALNLNDARYVVFKIPSALNSGDEGKNVIDTERPTASTPYTNAPLAPTADTAPPDERQLVPPRYRDLIK